MPRFTIDETAAVEWIGQAIDAYETGETAGLADSGQLPEIGEDYSPSTDGLDSGYSTSTLISCAQGAGIIAGPGEISYEFTSDDDEHGYRWFIYLDRLVLASLFSNVYYLGNKSYLGDRTEGADAALGVLEEAVSVANSLLDDLDNYIATRAA